MHFVRRLRAFLYDTAIGGLTSAWYRAVLTHLAPNCRVLDIGIGTGAALLANAAVIREKALSVTGVDIDAAYVDRCRRALAGSGCEDRVTVRLESIYDHRGGPYDAAYFSGSFMLLPDPVAALRHVAGLLAPGGRIYFTQTFEHERSRVLDRIKPLLRFLTTIDFGRVTYEPEFQRVVAEAGFAVERREVLRAAKRRTSILVVAAPQA